MVLKDDDNVEGFRRLDGGEYSSEEIGCDVTCGIDRFRCGFECPEASVL